MTGECYQPPFWGRAVAAGFVVDVPTIGESEARRRVVEFWQPGAELRALPRGRWLLILVDPVDIRCERAPGLPLGRSSRGLHPAGMVTAESDGEVRLLEGSQEVDYDLSSLPLMTPSTWIDTDTIMIGELIAIEPKSVAAALVLPPIEVPAVDLRRVSGLAPRSRYADTAAASFATRATRPGADPGTGSHPTKIGASASQRVLARLLLGSPAGAVLRSRQARYLRSLTTAFERGDLEDLLRDGIALSSTLGSGTISFRLPQRRNRKLNPSLTPPGGAASVLWVGTAHEHLTSLYRQAADALERQGRPDEAAFVHADLMNNPVAAVHLLERHGRHDLAAALADARDLTPELVVRLQWRAGNHARAIEVARSRGAFAAAVSRLEKAAPELAVSLRAEWASTLRGAGDHLAAIEVAWPVPGLRPAAIRDIEVALGMGGLIAARLLPYLLSHGPDAAATAQVMALIRGRAPEEAGQREEVIDALSELPCADPIVDRQLATAALRAILDVQTAPSWESSHIQRVRRALRGRADPVFRADFAGHPNPSRSGEPTLHAAASPLPGAVRVADVVVVASGDLLLALGEHGVRLVSSDGRTRASWDVRVDRLIPSDHGGAVLLLAVVADSTVELRRLDLADRQVSPPLVLKAREVIDTYDGFTLTYIDLDGCLSFLDLGATPPRLSRRELSDTGQALEVRRSAEWLSAVVAVAEMVGLAPARLEVWRWSLPSMLLRERHAVAYPQGQATISARARFVTLDESPEPGGTFVLSTVEGSTPRGTRTIASSATPRLVSSGPSIGVVVVDDAHLTVDVTMDGPEGDVDYGRITMTFTGISEVGFRSHGTVVCAWDATGRVLAIDRRRGVLARFSTSI